MLITNTRAYDTSRRIFRGKGGANDSRLPKVQARRRKGTKTAVKGTTKYENDCLVVVDAEHDDIGQVDVVAHSTIIPDSDRSEMMHECFFPAEKEMKHLKRRLGILLESIQLSSKAIANPVTWQANVLNAVQNAVNEWRAIVIFYPDLDTSAPFSKESSLAVYMLIQLAMQSGPLAGGKPGYFKRCGANAALAALAFLQTVMPDENEAAILGFSERQVDAIQKWKQNASNAIDHDKPPSKSVLKRQDHASKGNVK